MTNSKQRIFFGMQTLIDKKWVSDQAVIIENETIKATIPGGMIKHHLPAKQYEFPNDHYLVPGFIDLHIHGANGYDVMDGTEEALAGISLALATEGVTGYLATTMTAEDELIDSVLEAIAKMPSSKDGAAILGVHLEGPFIAKDKVGAQRKEAVRDPDLTLLQRWQKCAQGAIKIVTLAPELPNAFALIKLLREMHIKASIGHTNATYAQTCEAIAAGCTQATHLFNAMSGLHQREPGAVGALLLSDAIIAELIVDDNHLHPAIIEIAWRIKNKERLMLVTDAMRAKCLGDGEYNLGGQIVSVHENRATLADGTLAGSTLSMPQAIKNMVQFSHCTLAEAIAMASENPACAIGIEASKGSIGIGKDADLVVLNADLEVVLTMRAGRVVFQR